MMGYDLIFELIAAAFLLVIVMPIFALIGALIYRNKHLSGKRGALIGASVPFFGAVVGIIPYLVSVLTDYSVGSKITIGLYAPLISIPIGIVVLIVMQIRSQPVRRAFNGPR